MLILTPPNPIIRYMIHFTPEEDAIKENLITQEGKTSAMFPGRNTSGKEDS